MNGSKPCPFCGSDDLAIETEMQDKYFWVSAIRCEVCGAYGSTAFGNTEAIAVEDAWESWNTRYEPVKEADNGLD